MATKALNEMLTSPMALVAAAFIEDGADRMAAEAERTGSERIHQTTVILARRFANLLKEAAGEES
jgi:hypothetical protein